MNKHRDDILQIRKYLNGELNARAMHELERRAQDDPFLMDALEGYEAKGADQDANLLDLDERLQQRIAKKEHRIIPFRVMAIAASVLVFLTIGSVIWVMNRPGQVNQVKLTDIKLLPPTKPSDTIPPDVLKQKPELAKLSPEKTKQKSYYTPRLQKQASVTQYNASAPAVRFDPNADVAVDAPVGNADAMVAKAPTQKDSSRVDLAETVIVGYATRKRKDVTGAVSVVKPAEIATGKDKSITAASGSPAAVALAGKVAGVQVDIPKTKTVTGTVIAGDDHMPLPGVTVKVDRTGQVTQTDADGKFKLTGVPDDASLVVAFIGYTTKKVSINKRDSLNIKLNESSSALSEVVVIGYGKTSDDAVFEDAHPAKGWSDLRKYLKENATVPGIKPGKVRLSFTVDGNGELSDFKVLKSLSKDADAKAIDLLQNGPDWTPASDHKPQVVKVTVKFKPL